MNRVLTLIALAAAGVTATHADVLNDPGLDPRDLDGNVANGAEAYYDKAQDITWMADWRQGTAGGMNWPDARGWAAGLTLGGFNDWRLPKVGLSHCQAYNCVNGELGFLWYTVLGNEALVLSSRGPFVNMASGPYWTGTGVDPDEAWAFTTSSGFQFEALKSNRYAVVAVRDGDTIVSAVPEPSTAALLMAGVMAAIGVARHRQARRQS